MEIQFKTFVTHAAGKSADEGEDRVAFNLEKKRFAIADGVSASYFPHLLAEIVTNTFVWNDITPEHYQNDLDEGGLQTIHEKWASLAEELEGEADDKVARRLARVKRKYGGAASTLAGIWVEDDVMHYYALGDSCIFVINNNGLITISSIKDKDSFDNYPDYLTSYGECVGTPISGSLELEAGWIVMATDALSEWFWHRQEEEPGTIQTLWNLHTQYDFEKLIMEERAIGRLKNDDVAMVMIKTDNSRQTTSFPLGRSSVINNIIVSISKWLGKLLK